MADNTQPKQYSSYQIIGAGMKGIGTYFSGMAEADQFGESAKEADQQAALTRQRGDYETWRRNVQARQVIGQQRNAYAAGGIELQDTAADVLAASMKEMALDKLVAYRNSRQESAALETRAKYLRKAQKTAKTGAIIGGVSSALTALSAFA